MNILPWYHLGSLYPYGYSLDAAAACTARSEEHTSELQSRPHLVCRLLLEKKKKVTTEDHTSEHNIRILYFTMYSYHILIYMYSTDHT